MQMFDIGETVICVDASKQAHTIEELNKDVPNWVKQGERYTIRGFTENNGIVEAVWLEEIVNPLKFFKLINRLQEPAFAIWRFRKLRPDEVKEEVNIDELVILN